mmetsp:Transcript_2751/g.7648  ORF Transcript_2751/g.7648 Transcript_2751/m.7648 type:complete len:216 (+) Transcript_2751:270-917(+)
MVSVTGSKPASTPETQPQTVHRGRVACGLGRMTAMRRANGNGPMAYCCRITASVVWTHLQTTRPASRPGAAFPLVPATTNPMTTRPQTTTLRVRIVLGWTSSTARGCGTTTNVTQSTPLCASCPWKTMIGEVASLRSHHHRHPSLHSLQHHQATPGRPLCHPGIRRSHRHHHRPCRSRLSHRRRRPWVSARSSTTRPPHRRRHHLIGCRSRSRAA